MNILRTFRHRQLIKHINVPQEAFVLDTSCQDGSFLAEFIKWNSSTDLKVHGLDINESDIVSAGKLLPAGIFNVGNNQTIPFPDNNFDIVITSLTLHHMHNPIRSLSEMKRVLKKGASIYLIDVIAEGKIFEYILKRFKCPEPYHFEKFYSLREVKGLLNLTGLVIKSKKRATLLPLISILELGAD